MEPQQIWIVLKANHGDSRDDVLIMHPGPINRGIELTSDVADGPNSCIRQQVTNGLAIRMAVLYLVSQSGA